MRAAVLTATADVLDELGYDELTYDEVARRADVHRTTVYRRWPTKPELVAEALDLHSEEHVPIPDTGSLAGDLNALAAAVAANVSSPAGARRSVSIVAAAAHSDELRSLVQSFMTRRVVLTEPLVARAVERGELPTATDPRLVIEALVGPIWFRLLLTGEPLDDDFVAALTELVLTGARGGSTVP